MKYLFRSSELTTVHVPESGDSAGSGAIADAMQAIANRSRYVWPSPYSQACGMVRLATATSLNLSGASVGTKLGGTTTTVNLVGMTDGSVSNRLVSTDAHVYYVEANIWVNSDPISTEDVEFVVKANDATNVTVWRNIEHSQSGSDTHASLSMSGLVSLAAGEYVELWGKSDPILDDLDNVQYSLSAYALF